MCLNWLFRGERLSSSTRIFAGKDLSCTNRKAANVIISRSKYLVGRRTSGASPLENEILMTLVLVNLSFIQAFN